VSFGMVSALEPIGLMRRIDLGEVLRLALMGTDERVTAATALRIGLVSEVVPAADLHRRAQEIAATIAAKPSAATQGTVRAIWDSLDCGRRAALAAGQRYWQVGNPPAAKQFHGSTRKRDWRPR
jgi:enoyl-CoA hydratase/carnithine racemase